MNSIETLQEIFPLNTNSPADELEIITNNYPYFSLAQFYFLHHSKNDQSLFEKQSEKTALFFNNLHWLNWQISAANKNEESITTSYQPENIIPEEIEPIEEKPVFKPLPNFKSEVVEDTISFEPLHTTDYFLSQGIKLTEEPIANDKLGTQMKSFTEWLKSMKKIHAEKPLVSDEQTDKKIQTIAEDSNASADVVTEAMADVLVKQGKIEKAIETYGQLSLINPHKSAFFAAKIKSLKTP